MLNRTFRLLTLASVLTLLLGTTSLFAKPPRPRDKGREPISIERIVKEIVKKLRGQSASDTMSVPKP